MKGILTIVMLFGCSLLASAQYVTAYRNQFITLRSDNPAKSVLFSNVFANGTGDRSPLIGVALWQDSGKQFECRSLIEFDYSHLPAQVFNDPQLITSAELILYPKQATVAKDPFNFSVSMILKPWTDSFTNWGSQPPAEPSNKINMLLKPGRVKPVRIDVTRLVMNMLRVGNYGFMLATNDSLQNKDISGWFASAKYEDKRSRPILVINYLAPYLVSAGDGNESMRQKQLRSTPPSQAISPQPARNNN